MDAQTVRPFHCPGCLRVCPLDNWSCGRGKMFWERDQAGEEIPNRFGPDKPVGNKTRSEKIAHFLMVGHRVLRRRYDETPDEMILYSLCRRRGMAEPWVTTLDLGMNEGGYQQLLDGILEHGLATMEEVNGNQMAVVTEEGRKIGEHRLEERPKINIEYLSVLSDEEQDELLRLLVKLFKNQPPAPLPRIQVEAQARKKKQREEEAAKE